MFKIHFLLENLWISEPSLGILDKISLILNIIVQHYFWVWWRKERISLVVHGKFTYGWRHTPSSVHGRLWNVIQDCEVIQKRQTTAIRWNRQVTFNPLYVIYLHSYLVMVTLFANIYLRVYVTLTRSFHSCPVGAYWLFLTYYSGAPVFSLKL